MALRGLYPLFLPCPEVSPSSSPASPSFPGSKGTGCSALALLAPWRGLLFRGCCLPWLGFWWVLLSAGGGVEFVWILMPI